MELVRRHNSENGTVLSFGPTIFVEWKTNANNAILAAADLCIDDLAREYGDGRKLLYVHRLPPSVEARIDREAQMKVVDHFKRHEDRFLAAGVSLEATGIRGSLWRTAAASIMLLARSAVKVKIADRVVLAVHWVAQNAHEEAPFSADGFMSQYNGERKLAVGAR